MKTPLQKACLSFFPFLIIAFLGAADLLGEKKTAQIQIDHKTLKVIVEIDGKPDSREYRSGDEIPVSASKIEVIVKNTNTALYTHSLAAKEIEPKDFLAWQNFMSDLVPFIVAEYRSVLPLRSAKEIITLETDAETGLKMDFYVGINEQIEKITNSPPAVLEKILDKIHELLYEKDGLRDVYIRTISLIKDLFDNPIALAAQTRDLLRPVFHPTKQKFIKVDELISELDKLNSLMMDLNSSEIIANIDELMKSIGKEKKESLQNEIENLAIFQEQKTTLLNNWKNKLEEIQDYANKLVKNFEENQEKAEQILENSENLILYAYYVENILKKAWNAENTIKIDSFDLPYSQGKEIALCIQPIDHPMLARYATEKPVEIILTLQRQLPIRPFIGVAVIYAKKAAFPTYSTKEVDGSHEIIEESSLLDRRLNFGLTLGMTWPFLDWRENHGTAILFPEFTISADAEVKFFGLGASVSLFNFIKIGGGCLWLKHTRLGGGQEIGESLPASTDLNLKDTYGRPRFYLSVSIIGWPPFKK